MKVNEEVQQYIRKDAKVKVGTDGLIGNKIIVIYGGTSRAAPIESGDTLAIEETFSTEDMMNTLQENNKNILDITNDLKVVSKKLASGEGSIGKILNDEDLHKNISAATYSLKRASGKAEELMNSFASFSAKLNKKGTLVNDLVTDTSTFHSLKSSISNLQKVTDTASVLMNDLRAAGSNSKTPAGVLLHDEEAGQQLKNTIRNLESGSKKLDEDLEAVRHNFLLRKYFRKKNKE
jgi:phospholipid/cholesterol/gamma-HCH transport system substrate-binding protein